MLLRSTNWRWRVVGPRPARHAVAVDQHQRRADRQAAQRHAAGAGRKCPGEACRQRSVAVRREVAQHFRNGREALLDHLLLGDDLDFAWRFRIDAANVGTRDGDPLDRRRAHLRESRCRCQTGKRAGGDQLCNCKRQCLYFWRHESAPRNYSLFTLLSVNRRRADRSGGTGRIFTCLRATPSFGRSSGSAHKKVWIHVGLNGPVC